MLAIVIGFLALIAFKLFKSAQKQKRAPLTQKRAKELFHAYR